MSRLFDRTKIRGMVLENRFVRSATWEGMAAPDGSATARLVEYMAELARGGVGLIVSGHAYVGPEGQAGPHQLGIHTDECIAGLSGMADAVHEAGGRIVVQLAHAGCNAGTALTGLEARGPSAPVDEKWPPCAEMTREDILRVVESFGRAAVRAQRAGFDGVQVHAAHGYLLSEFLSPFFNRREDAYGGNVENRARIVVEVIREIRDRAGDGFPIFIKMNAQDFLEGGLSVDHMLETAGLLQEAGTDGIELSGGTFASGRCTPSRFGKLDSREKEVYYREEARKYKERITVPLTLVGGIRSFETAEGLVEDGVADYISLCRPLIREPGLINRWKSGNIARSECRSDNLCFRPALEGEGLYCVVAKRARERAKV